MEITMTSSRRLSLVVLFACCLGYSQISPTTPSTPEAGVATVYFYEYQLAGIKIGKLLLPVNCDGTKIAALEPNSSFAYSVSPGKHVLTSSDKRNAIELNAKPGDVIAQDHGRDPNGGEDAHAGIIVAPGKTASANANEGGTITVNDWGFRNPNGNPNNGERNGSNSPAPVVRHPEDQ